MKHRHDGRTAWKILRDAGIVLIIFMGLGLIGLALGVAMGMRLL